jgi:K+-sensing histidine kinase KdpD
VVRLGDERRAVLMAVGPLGEAAAPDGAVVSIIPVQHEGALQEQRRHLVARLLHDLRTPLSGIGVAAELLDPGASEMPPGLVDALRMHHADLLRYVSELADFTLLDMDERLPTAQALSLDDAFEAVVWRLSMHLQRRAQTLRVDSAVTRPVMLAQQFLEQALMAVVFDVSTYATSGTTLTIRAHEHGQRATIAVEGRGGALPAEEVGALTDPYLRVRPGAHTSGLMSLAATKHALVYYGGTLQVMASRTRLCISLSLPLASTP